MTMMVGLVIGLAGCGGGGDDAGTRPSMVPAAPALGAQLYADASVLRPVFNGVSWDYLGSYTQPGVAAVPYDDLVTQASQTAGTATETASNYFNGGASAVTVQVAGGVARSTVYDYYGNALSPLGIELRSPVFVNDQITLDQETVADSGFDVDGDHRSDAVDFAIFRRVIGNENVVLPSLGTVVALRVDTYYLIRFIASSNGALSPVTQVTQSVWYATGIGIVRQTLTAPHPGGGSDVWDEVLSSYGT